MIDGTIDIGRCTAFFVSRGIVCNQTYRQCIGWLEQQLATQEVAVAIVDVVAILVVAVETVTLYINAINAERDLIRNRASDAGCSAHEVIIAVGQLAVDTKGEAWLFGIDANETSRRVTSAQCTLRSTLHFNTVNFAEFVQTDARTRTVYAVDENRDRAFEAGIVTDRTDTANTGRTVGFRTRRRDEQRWCNLVQLANVVRAAILEGFGINGGNRDWHVRQ